MQGGRGQVLERRGQPYGMLPSRAEDTADYINNFFATNDPSNAPSTRASRRRSVSALMLKTDLATAAIEIGDVVCDAHQRRADYRPR